MDYLYGGAGRDILYGSDGNDTLYGGAGNDIFQITSASNNGIDLIVDYEVGGDRIKLLGGLTENDLNLIDYNYAGQHTLIRYDNDYLAIVQDTISADIIFF